MTSINAQPSQLYITVYKKIDQKYIYDYISILFLYILYSNYYHLRRKDLNMCLSPYGYGQRVNRLGAVLFFFLNKNLKYTHKPSNTYDHKVKSNIFLINKFELIIFKDKFKSLSALYQVSINCIPSPLFKINHLTWELPHEKRNGDCRHAGRDPHVGLPPRGTFLRSGGIAHRRTRVYHRGGEEWIQFNKYKNNIVIHTAGHTGLEGCVPISLKIPISVRGRPLLLIITVLSFFLLYFFCFFFFSLSRFWGVSYLKEAAQRPMMDTRRPIPIGRENRTRSWFPSLAAPPFSPFNNLIILTLIK